MTFLYSRLGSRPAITSILLLLALALSACGGSSSSSSNDDDDSINSAEDLALTKSFVSDLRTLITGEILSESDEFALNSLDEELRSFDVVSSEGAQVALKGLELSAMAAIGAQLAVQNSPELTSFSYDLSETGVSNDIISVAIADDAFAIEQTIMIEGESVELDFDANGSLEYDVSDEGGSYDALSADFSASSVASSGESLAVSQGNIALKTRSAEEEFGPETNLEDIAFSFAANLSGGADGSAISGNFSLSADEVSLYSGLSEEYSLLYYSLGLDLSFAGTFTNASAESTDISFGIIAAGSDGFPSQFSIGFSKDLDGISDKVDFNLSFEIIEDTEEAFIGAIGSALIAYNDIEFNIDYNALNTDDETITITNQNEVRAVVRLTDDESNDISGTITRNGQSYATIEEDDNGIYIIRYSDGTFESIN